jgi:hypothetical protein
VPHYRQFQPRAQGRRYIAKLFGSNNTEGTVRLITALLVLDPVAALLTLAATGSE